MVRLPSSTDKQYYGSQKAYQAKYSRGKEL